MCKPHLNSGPDPDVPLGLMGFNKTQTIWCSPDLEIAFRIIDTIWYGKTFVFTDDKLFSLSLYFYCDLWKCLEGIFSCTVTSSLQNGHHRHKSSRRTHYVVWSHESTTGLILARYATQHITSWAVSSCTRNTWRPEGTVKLFPHNTTPALSDHYSHRKSSAESLISSFCISAILILHNENLVVQWSTADSVIVISLLHSVLLTPAGQTSRSCRSVDMRNRWGLCEPPLDNKKGFGKSFFSAWWVGVTCFRLKNLLLPVIHDPL